MKMRDKISPSLTSKGKVKRRGMNKTSYKSSLMSYWPSPHNVKIIHL